MKALIVCGGISREIEFSGGELLAGIIQRSGFEFSMPCAGKGHCGKCRVTASGELSAHSDIEKLMLTDAQLAQGMRLACMTKAFSDVTITLPEPETEKYILSSFDEKAVGSCDCAGEGFGIAADVGTTTVAAVLYDLKNKKILATSSRKNPQSAYGADVVSRVSKALEGKLGELQSGIIACLSDIITEMCSSAGVRCREVENAVITGNTAMLYLLCGESPSSLAAAPFRADDLFGRSVDASALSLPLAQNARVYLPRCVSAYVGADITCAMLACGFFEKEQAGSLLLADIGTNGEIALLKNGKTVCCSTAAGPAFEGAGIRFGMNANDGAIAAVRFLGGDLLSVVLGEKEACGICGSGLIDAISGMLCGEIIDETGFLLPCGHAFEDDIRELDGEDAFFLPRTGVAVTQRDIRAVQLAKSAICSGILSLFKYAASDAESTDTFFIAGGFGNSLNTASARRIGLIPEGLARKACAVGNAALSGALMLLGDTCLRKKCEDCADAAETLELSSYPFFGEAYIDNMMF
ncbi:MAG: DUF4445 domain-containing protein [Clostridiales bacterium]|nr:DUF4445 domain-containing protein [Clostridiales bacterium]